MSIITVIREAINDDITGLASSTRVALLSATWTLSVGLIFAEFTFAIQVSYGIAGAQGWTSVIDHLCVCLALVLTGYAAKMISNGAFKRQPDCDKESTNG